MAKSRRNPKKSNVSAAKAPSVVWKFPLHKKNFYIMGVGLAVIILAYALMFTGITGEWNNPMAVTVAPLLLVLGYLVIIPFGLLKKFETSPENSPVN